MEWNEVMISEICTAIFRIPEYAHVQMNGGFSFFAGVDQMPTRPLAVETNGGTIYWIYM